MKALFLFYFCFLSQHDYPAHCRPGGQEGNYIMFASATSGDRFNNNKFSNCSKHNVSRVLDAIVDNLKPNCFQENDGAFCGNKIVEIGEEVRNTDLHLQTLSLQTYFSSV